MVLAVVFAHDARPAQAQSTTIWSATLTVGDLQSLGAGCDNGSGSGVLCTPSDLLTDNAFTYGGVEYRINALRVTSGTLVFTYNQPIPDSLKLTVLHVDGTAFNVADASYPNTNTASWRNSGLIWSVGDTVQLSLETLPPEVTVSSSGPLREGGPPVNVTFTLNRPAPRNLHATLGHNDSVRFNADGPRFAAGATSAVMQLSVPQDQIDNNCRTLHLQVWFLPYVDGAQVQADVAFSVIDDDGAADTCSGLLGSPYPTQLSLQFVEASRWTEKIRVTYLAQLDRPPLNRNVVSVRASSDTIIQRDGFSGADGNYYYVPRDRFSIWAPHTVPKYTDDRGTHDWPIEIWIWDSVPDHASITLEATTQFPALSITAPVLVNAMRGLADRQSSPGIVPEGGGSPGTDSDVGVVHNPNPQNRYASLIADVKLWRDDPCCASNTAHTDRWDRVLLALGESVADASLQPMTASEAQGFADRGWTRWTGVAEALREREAAAQNDPVPPAVGPDPGDSSGDAPGSPGDAPDAGPGAGPEPANQSPTVASAPADVSGIEAGATREVPLAGVFHDPDGDALTITGGPDDDAIVTVEVASDGSRLTLTGVSEGTAIVLVFAQDPSGASVFTEFNVTVVAAPEPETEGLSQIAARYDADSNGKIDVSEYRRALNDYVARTISYTELLEVVTAYQAS